MILIDFFKKLKVTKSNFVKDILILVGGTGFAQVISFLLTPVLTRIYSPKEYGILGLFTMVVLVLGILPTLQLQNIIIIEKVEDFAKKATGVTIIIASTIAFSLFLILLFTKEYLSTLLNIVEYENWLLLVPLLTWTNSIYLLLMSWANRRGNFKLMSVNRIILAIFVPVISILLSYLTKNATGLIIGYILGNFLVTFLLIHFFIIREKLNFSFCVADIKEVLVKYKDFPKFSLPSTIINIFINQIPILMLGKYSSTASVGHFNLSNRTLGMPIVLISSSFNEVFKQRATLEYNKHGKCDRIFLKSFFSLLIISILSFSVFALYGSEIFTFVFGEQWRNAGKYSAIMVPLFIMRFSISPLTYLFVIANKQKDDLWGHIGMLFFITLSFPISYSLSEDTISMITGYTISYCIVYLYYLVKSYHFSRGIKNAIL